MGVPNLREGAPTYYLTNFLTPLLDPPPIKVFNRTVTCVRTGFLVVPVLAHVVLVDA